MLWLFANLKLEPNQEFEFYQVFIDSKLVYDNDSNQIFSLGNPTDNDTDSLIKKIISNNSINPINPIKFNIGVKILDQLIMYTYTFEPNFKPDSIFNPNSYSPDVFSFKMNFIPPTAQSNEFGAPMFSFSYKKVNSNRMPNLIESQYNFNANLDLHVYNIDKNIQLVIENDTLTNTSKKYWVTNNKKILYDFLTKII